MVETSEQEKGNITLADIEKCVAKYGGQRTSAMLSALERNRYVYNSLNTEIGQVFFGEAMGSLKSLFLKVMNNDATEEERIEYKVTRRLLLLWGNKLAAYEKLKSKLTEGDENA